MKTNLMAILTAVGIAVVASPVMAASYHHSALGSARTIAAPVVEGSQIRVDDAVHVAFPQQSGGGY